MNELPKSTPTLPTLTFDNYTYWQYTITLFAIEHGIEHHLTSDIAITADDNTPRLQRAHADRIIVTTIPDDVRLQLPSDFLTKTPWGKMTAVQTLMTRDQTTVKHDLLQDKAMSLKMAPSDSLDSYLISHLKIRQEMVSANYPNISQEATTIKFILKGMVDNPRFRPDIPRLLSMNFLQINQCRLELEIIDGITKPDPQAAAGASTAASTASYGLWCAFHNSFGGHTTENCRAMRAARSRHYTSLVKQEPSTRGRGRGQARRSRGRGRGRGQYRPQRTAYATPHHKEQDPDQHAEPHQQLDGHQYDDQEYLVNDSVDFEDYIVDTGCTPSYSTERYPQQKPTTCRKFAMADGRTAYTIAEGKQQYHTADGGKLTIPTLAYSPAIRQNLLSVPDVTRTNKCVFVFTENGGYIARSRDQPAPRRIMQRIHVNNGLYHTKLRKKCQTTAISNRHRQTHNVMRIQTKIDRFFTKGKPRPRRLPPRSIRPENATRTTASIPVRGSKTDTVTHTIPYPSNLPQPQPQRKRSTDIAYSWHLRLNHVAPTKIRAMAKLPYPLGLPRSLAKTTPPSHCSSCSAAHIQRAPHKQTTARPPAGHTLVTDIAGPFPKSIDGYQYFLTVTELRTRMTHVQLMKTKSEAEQHLLAAAAKFRRHLGHMASRVRCDNANEYLTKTILKVFHAQAINLNPTTAHTPQENSISERLNKTLMTRVRATLRTAQLPFDHYWPYALLDTVGKTNSTLHTGINDIPRKLWEEHRTPRSPFEPRTLNLHHYRMFGEYAYIPQLRTIKKKAEDRGLLVRYLYTIDNSHFKVIHTANGQLLTCRMKDYRPYNPHYDPSTRYYHPIPRQLTRTPKVNLHHVIPREALNTQSVTRPPRTHRAALAHPHAAHWRAAYKEEVIRHQRFGTFEYVDRANIPRHAKVYKPVQTYTYKHDKKGNVVGHKVRFSYPGNRLVPGVHYNPNEIAVHTADRDTVRLILSIAAAKDLELKHIDLKSAFLHEQYTGPTLYLEPLPSFDGKPTHPDKVAVVRKNIYGTPQAPKIYAVGLQQHLEQGGYKRCKTDVNLYQRTQGSDFLIFAITIDDFKVATNSEQLYQQLLTHIRKKYHAKDLGDAAHIIGWSINRNRKRGTMHVSQPKLAQSFINAVRMQASNPADMPCIKGQDLSATRQDETPLDTQMYPYAHALGLLRYLADSTRPDLAFITGALARHLQKPARRHWAALKYVARYLKRTIAHGLLYRRGPVELMSQSDADFANCRDTRQSTYGRLTYSGPNLISWCSRRIRTVVTSTCEAEYIAASNTAKHTIWLRSMMSEIFHQTNTPTKLEIDNTAALTIAQSQAATKRSKYIDIRYHHLRDFIHQRRIAIRHLPSAKLQCDALTKPLTPQKFAQHLGKLCLPPPAQHKPKAVESLQKPICAERKAKRAYNTLQSNPE